MYVYIHFNEHGNILFRLVADILNDIALFMELLAPLIPFLFLTIVCVASAAKVRRSICMYVPVCCLPLLLTILLVP